MNHPQEHDGQLANGRLRYSLFSFCLICVLASLLIALVGISTMRHPTQTPWEGFPPGTPRQEGFVAPGQLVYDVIEDVHGGNGLHVRLHVRIKLNHDRVFLHSIETCVSDIGHVCYSLQDSLDASDPAFVEGFVTDHLVRFNGTSAVESVELIRSQLWPKSQLQQRGIESP